MSLPTDKSGCLCGKVVLVTGASEGIGFGIADRAVAEGASVVLTGRRSDQLRRAADALDGPAVPVVGDVSDPAARTAAVSAAIERFGRLDVVVNNAAYVPPMRDVLSLADSELERVWQVNLSAPIQLVRLAHEAYLAEHGGVVLNIGSVGGLALQPGMGAYSMAKAGLHHLTRFLAAELAPDVRVNAIAPGPIRTPGTDTVWDALGDRAVARIPAERLGTMADVASAALFLMDDAAGWITGQTLVVDGGTSVQSGRRVRRSD